MAAHRVSQYRLTDSRIRDTGGSTLVHARNFSPILYTSHHCGVCSIHRYRDYHASKATGFVDSIKPMVAGFVACWNAYELAVFMFSRPLRRPSCSASVISYWRCSGSSSMLQKLTQFVSEIILPFWFIKLTMDCYSELVRTLT